MQRDEIKQILKGFLLYGSRMNPDALPREGKQEISDIDIIWVADREYEQTERIKLANLIREEWLRKKYPVPLDFYWNKGYTVDLFTPCVNSNIPYMKSIPFWAWKPNAVYYIGTLPNMEEEEVNRRLREQLESDAVRKIKQVLIQEIKNSIKVHDRKFYKIKGNALGNESISD